MKIIFTPHALRKFSLLEKYGFFITQEKIAEIIRSPDRIIIGKKGRKIAQARIDEEHLLRIVFEEKIDKIEVITFYPCRRDRYESQL